MNKQEKEKQVQMNHQIEEAIERFNKDDSYRMWIKQLRNCNAVVYGQGQYIVLRSYNTIVAFIDTETDTLYDILRWAYGYTATSAQHIAKFDQDYGAGKWGCAHRMTYRYV